LILQAQNYMTELHDQKDGIKITGPNYRTKMTEPHEEPHEKNHMKIPNSGPHYRTNYMTKLQIQITDPKLPDPITGPHEKNHMCT
jgi:hypothetical protein